MNRRTNLIDDCFDDVAKVMLEQDPFLTTSEILEKLNSAHKPFLTTLQRKFVKIFLFHKRTELFNRLNIIVKTANSQSSIFAAEHIFLKILK